MSVFDDQMRKTFAANYPALPAKLHHHLHEHPLLTLEALADYADRKPKEEIECNLADLPLNVVGNFPDQLLDNVGDRIRNMETAGSWIHMRFIERDPEYKALIDELLGEFRDLIEDATGEIVRPQGFVFITSPGGTTPYHFDPEHNVLMQIRGSKVMTLFPANDPRFAPDEFHETYHATYDDGGRPDLPWSDDLMDSAFPVEMQPGDAVHVPFMAPHFVKNGPEVAVSLSVTWSTEWCYNQIEARLMNRMLRARGLNPAAPANYPHSSMGKAYAMRAMRRLKLAS